MESRPKAAHCAMRDYSGKSGKLRATPAMMAGLADRLWCFEDLYDAVTV